MPLFTQCPSCTADLWRWQRTCGLCNADIPPQRTATGRRRRLLATVFVSWVTALTIAPTLVSPNTPVVDSFAQPPTTSIAIDAGDGDQVETVSVEQPHP